MGTITTYQSNIQIHQVSGNSKSKFPKSKIATMAVCVFTLTNANIAINQHTNGLHFSTKSKREIVEISNESSGASNRFTFIKEEGGEDMTDLKLNDIQQHFDNKLSDVKDTVHSIDVRTAVIENEIKHIQKDIKEIPNIIKSTLLEIESEKVKDKKDKFWDRYFAPIIVGLIIPAIIYIGPIIIKHLK